MENPYKEPLKKCILCEKRVDYKNVQVRSGFTSLWYLIWDFCSFINTVEKQVSFYNRLCVGVTVSAAL